MRPITRWGRVALGGALVDRWNRKIVMVTTDLGRAVLLVLLPYWNSVVGLVVVSFLLEVLTLLWGPAKDAALPSVVPKEQLANANSLGLVASYGTFPFGGVIFSSLAVVATWLGGFEALKSLSVSKETIALCRCGHSQKKPFCDGAHAAEGFQAE